MGACATLNPIYCYAMLYSMKSGDYSNRIDCGNIKAAQLQPAKPKLDLLTVLQTVAATPDASVAKARHTQRQPKRVTAGGIAIAKLR